jgi:hypothetical protein
MKYEYGFYAVINGVLLTMNFAQNDNELMTGSRYARDLDFHVNTLTAHRTT